MNLKTKISKVSTQTLGTLGNRVIDTVNNSGIEEAKNSKHFQMLVELNNAYQQAVEPINVKLMASQIDERFKMRNLLFAEMGTITKGLMLSDDADVKTAALMIYEELTKFGTNFSNMRMADKTLRYIRIIESLKQDKYADALLKTKLKDKLDTLDSVQREYENLYMNRGNMVAGKIAASNIRKEMEAVMKKHLDETTYLKDVHETDAWNVLYNNLKKRYAEVSISLAEKKKQTENIESKASTVTAS